MSKYAYTVSEIALAEAIASAMLRTPDAIKQEIVEVTLDTVKIPEVRSVLVKAAKAVGIELAEDDSVRDPATGRTPRGAAIALGWKRRNEGIAAAKAAGELPSADVAKAAAHEPPAPATASDSKGGFDPAFSEPKTQLGPLRAILPPTSRPAPPSAVSGSTSHTTEDRRDGRDD